MSDYADNLRKSMINKTRRFMRMVQEMQEKDDAALREQVIRMAREAGLYHFYDSEGHCDGITDARLVTEDKERDDDRMIEMLVPFAALAAAAGAAAEREACAKVCDDEALRCEAAVQRAEPDEVSAIRSTAWKLSVCAAAIRARGEK